MADARTPGPLTQDELLDLWKSSVDPLYAQPLLEQGEGFGLEAHTQAQAQLARVSKAIDATTQALYIRAWSGQTAAPAAGETHSTVTLTMTRTGLSAVPVTLTAGVFVVQEQTTDYGDDGPVTVLTGRKYTLVNNVTWGAGDTSTKSVAAIAIAPGAGFNNPMPGTLKAFDQPGSGFNNTLASVTVGNVLVVRNFPDVVIPDHVGQYVQFMAGANAGQVRRILSYTRPNLSLTPPTGGSVILEGAALTPEYATAAWRILDWAGDFGLTATNLTSPIGGGLGTLDALGAERKIPRSSGETSAQYAERISQIADVVTPNAIRRAANRVLAQYNVQCQLLEPGNGLDGLFYDGNPFSVDPAEAYAYDMTLTGIQQAKFYLDYREFRGFFLLKVPRLSLGEFGFPYDVGGSSAFDTVSPYAAFMDGQPIGTWALYRQVYDAVNKAHAGGVDFDLTR